MSDYYHERARAIWTVMQKEAKNRGFARVKDKTYGDGRIIIGTIGAFASALSSERDWNLTKNDKDHIRQYLKVTGNVVILEKLEQYRFRIFVREEWSESAIHTPEAQKDAIDRRAERLDPSEVGEDMQTPVTYKCADCKKEFSSSNALNGHRASHKSDKPVRSSSAVHVMSPIGEKAAKIIQTLADMNGDIKDKSGFVAGKIRKQAGMEGTIADSLMRLESHGLITRKVNAKRTYRVTLTDQGWHAANNINLYRSSTEVVRELISDKGAIWSEDGGLYPKLASMTGLSVDRVSKGARDLEDEGFVIIKRNNDVGRPCSMYLKTEDSVPNFSETSETGVQSITEIGLEDATDNALLEEIGSRLKTRLDTDDLQEKLEMIASIVDDAVQGKTSPLKALSDIQEAVEL